MPALLKALTDDYRLVRIRTAAGLAGLPYDNLSSDEKKHLETATAELLSSLRERADDFASYYNLGNFYLAQGRALEAAQAYNNALKLRPDFALAYVNKSLAYSLAGDHISAEASLRSALKIDPANAPASLNLGLLFAEMGKTKEAEQALRQALKSEPKLAQAAYNLGALLFKEHPQEALDFLEKAYRLEPYQSKYGYAWAFYLKQSAKPKQAAEVLKQVLREHPGNKDAVLLLRSIEQN